MYQGRFSGEKKQSKPEAQDDSILKDSSFADPGIDQYSDDYAYGEDPYSADYGAPQDQQYDPQGYSDPQYSDAGYSCYDAYGTQNGQQSPFGGDEAQTYGNAYYHEPAQEPSRRKVRKGPIVVGLLFYLVLAGCVGLFMMQNQKSLQKLQEDLLAFEQAQPVYISQQVFEELFGDPDWAVLYEKAGIQDTAYENSQSFTEFMESRVDSSGLAYRQLTFDPAQPLTYGVFAGGDKLGQFTLQNHGASPQTPLWELDELHLFYTPDQSFRILLQDGQTVQVNGVELDDSYVIEEEYTQTLEESPIRLSGTRLMEIQDLMVRPEVTAVGADGSALAVSFDGTTGTFTVPGETDRGISPEQEQLALDTLHAYCKFMINKGGGAAGLAKYFKQNTDTFKAIVGSDLTWVQKESAHNFANEEVSDFVSYGENKFSVHVDLIWQLTRPDGSVKESQVEKTLVFEKSNSEWLCTRMTGFDLTAPVKQVRLRFWNGDQVLDAKMVEAAADTVACPLVTAPAGKQFSGWAVLKTGEDGSSFYQRVLAPGEDGNAHVASSLTLEPMDLYPVFESV